MNVIGRPTSRNAHIVPDEKAQILAVINEIWMLVDYVAGNSSKSLSEAKVPNGAAGTYMTPTELLQAVSSTNARLVEKGQVLPDDRARMQMVRDALNVLVRPASGLSIAYTAIVTGPLRSRAASRFALAQQAYPNLTERGAWHRCIHAAILILLVLVTGAAVWESAKVALGKALLQNLDTLRVQQAGLNAEKLKLDLSLTQPADPSSRLEDLVRRGSVPLSSYRLCDRATTLLALATQVSAQQPASSVTTPALSGKPIYGSAEERDVCGRDYILRTNLDIVHGDLTTYTRNWPSMVGSLPSLLGNWFAKIRNLLQCLSLECRTVSSNSLPWGQDDVEFKVAPVLLVWGNFVLPIIFGFIGSAIFVLLDHYKKVINSLLNPKDYFLAPVRLMLGLVVGACVGLFFSAYGPVAQPASAPIGSALVSSLMLSASGVAFLAGFGVETVFGLLEEIIGRIFTLPTAPK